MSGGREAIGILLRNYFALFRKPNLSSERVRRQGFQENAGGSGPTPDGSAAAMRESHIDMGLASHRDQTLLRFSQIPMAGEDATVLVAVAVADHHFLERPGTPLL